LQIETSEVFIKRDMKKATAQGFCAKANPAKSYMTLNMSLSFQIVVWLPALCRKMNVPYCIVKGKARLAVACNKNTLYVAMVFVSIMSP
jgi:hypothetical protein